MSGTITDEMNKKALDRFYDAGMDLYYMADTMRAALEAVLSALPDAGEGAIVQAAIDRVNRRRGEPAPDRNAVIEECARIAETKCTVIGTHASIAVAKAIRALKSPTSPSAESEKKS